MIKMRRAQLGFGDGLIQAEIADLREDWMVHADQVLEDEQLVATVYEALGKRHPNSRSRGRQGTPADVVLRLLVLKHVRNWSYEVLEREVRANLVYRDFTRVGGAKMPDAKTMGRWDWRWGRRSSTGSPADRYHRPSRECDAGPQNARGHHGDGDQHPLSHRLQLAGRRGAGADPHHEEDH